MGVTFEHFLYPIFGDFHHKFCPRLQTFEFYCAEIWVLHVNSCFKMCHLRKVVDQYMYVCINMSSYYFFL